MIDSIFDSLKVKKIERIDIYRKFDKSSLMSIASKAMPTDNIRHPVVAEFIAWQMTNLAAEA